MFLITISSVYCLTKHILQMKWLINMLTELMANI